jgi:pyruvate kinase
MPQRFQPKALEPLLQALEELRHAALDQAAADGALVERVPATWRASARNLLHYLAVRGRDIRPLQRDLARLGLSSLGRMECHVQHTLQSVASTLRVLRHEPPIPPVDAALAPDADTGPLLLAAHARELLGSPAADRGARIMVTLPSEAATNAQLVRDLVAAGMDVARINLAHDGPEQWSAMVRHVRAATAASGRSCRIHVDLAGPKLRTGALVPGPCVQRIRPSRDEVGRVVTPARVVLAPPGGVAAPATTGAAAVLALTEDVSAAVKAGDLVCFDDARGRSRTWSVREVVDSALIAEGKRTAYVLAGTELTILRNDTTVARTRIGALPPLPGYLLLHRGDELILTRGPTPGQTLDGPGRLRGRIPCTLPEVFAHAAPGQSIAFDDGHFRGRIIAREGEDLHVRIDEAPEAGGKLREEKGINLPDTDLHLPALTAQDRQHLDWVAANADMVGMSFVSSPADVRELEAELARRDAGRLGIVLKIETKRAFERLPELLLAGLCSPPVGVMVARGDLAVEVGFARLAEVQEEILWLCEAAHVPVIWATQVLETMARTGQPSRAEVSDAAMSAGAECVMLNKGPFVVEAVRFLSSVLSRMQDHHEKKRAMLRRLAIASNRWQGSEQRRLGAEAP